MYGPHYVWILFSLPGSGNKWWAPKPDENLDCNDVNIACAAQNLFYFTGHNDMPPPTTKQIMEQTSVRYKLVKSLTYFP